MRVESLGTGPRVLLVHGSVTNSATWGNQRELADRFTLVIPDRPGYLPNPPLDRIDFERQADELAELLDAGAHVVGFSYGGVISLLLAARQAGRVLSLTVIEPPCFAVVRGDPAVDALVREMRALWDAGIIDPAEFVLRFSALFGDEGQVPAEVDPEYVQGVRALMAERGPWEAEIPLAELAAAPFPTLVCSSGGHPAYEAVCDVLERRLGAERAVLPGAGHGVHHAPGFNERLIDFLERADRP